jgi:hypothetical protein
MARITKQDVFRVASEIDARGDKPSVVEIRKCLGAGSYTTITAALREWVKPEEQSDDDVVPMPSSVAEKIEQFGDDLYSMIFRVAEEQFDEERKAWADEKKSLLNEIQEASKISDMGESSIEELNLQVFEVRKDAAESVANARLWEMRFNESILDRERALLEAAASRDEASSLRGRVEALEKMLDRAAVVRPAAKSSRSKPGKPSERAVVDPD